MTQNIDPQTIDEGVVSDPSVSVQNVISLPVQIPQHTVYQFADEFRIQQTRAVLGRDQAALLARISSSEGRELLTARAYAYSKFSQYARIVTYSQTEQFRLSITVEKDRCNVYRPRLMKYLPDEFAIKDYDDDLSQYLQVVAISMDEFYCFIEEFTRIFDPDKCPVKYLPYLAKLINWPLNTRGFDSPNVSIQQASVSRARKQLSEAVEVYKRKGLKEAFQILFYALGYYVELVELWTNNYVSFVEEVPADERMYDPVLSPNGWFKSPYFGIRLTSLDQSIEISTGGEGQPWNFDPDDLKEILDAVHSIRPVHTVLYWINYYFDLVEKFEFTDLPMENSVSWEPNDKFFNCTPGDPIYLRDDRRLDGITRNGTDSLAIRHVRDPKEEFCDPDIGIEAELSEINWIPEPWCTQEFRDAGLLYRDGYNMNPRNGVVATRDPSAFGGRNGFRWKDAPLAPFNVPTQNPDGTWVENENDLVWSRNGCYGPTISRMQSLYQLAEEAEDGLTLYYNEHEFQNWLDSMAGGFGPMPDLKQAGQVAEFRRSQSPISDPRLTEGNVMVDADTAICSVAGRFTEGAGQMSMTRFVFSSLGIQSTSVIPLETSPGVPYGVATVKGCTAYHSGKIFYAGGNSLTGVNEGPGLDTLLEIDPLTGAVTATSLGGDLLQRAAFAQIGSKLYVAPGGVSTPRITVIDLDSKSISRTIPIPAVRNNAACIAVNEYLYIFGGTGDDGQPKRDLWRVNTITDTLDVLAQSPFAGRKIIAFRRNNTLYFCEATGDWTSLPGRSTFLKYDLTAGTWAHGSSNDQLGSLDLTHYVMKQGRLYGTGNYRDTPSSSVVQILDFAS